MNVFVILLQVRRLGILISWLAFSLWMLSIKLNWSDHQTGMEDSLCWRSASDGRFTIKAAYRDIEKTNGSTSSLLWMRIWRRPVYEKVKSFLWKLAHERIQTNVTTDVNKIIVPRIWPFACNSQDSALNIIRDSYKAKEVWHKLIKHSMSNRFSSLSMQECILWN